MALSTHSLVLFAHLLAASLLIGSGLFSPLARRGIASAATLAELRTWLDLARRAALANPPAALALLGTGVWLGREVWWHFAWFWVAVGAWVANSALAAGVVKRSAAATAQAAARAGDGPVPPQVDRLRSSHAWHTAESVMTANDLALLYVMIDKPSLAGSLAVVALANLLVLGSRAVARRRAAGPSAGSRTLAAAGGR